MFYSKCVCTRCRLHRLKPCLIANGFTRGYIAIWYDMGAHLKRRRNVYVQCSGINRDMQQDMHDRTTCLHQHLTQCLSECMHLWSLGDRTKDRTVHLPTRDGLSRRHNGPRALEALHRRVQDLASHSRARRSSRAHM